MLSLQFLSLLLIILTLSEITIAFSPHHWVGECHQVAPHEVAQLYASLERKTWQLLGGIGKRYICPNYITRVHTNPASDNVITLLSQGQVVTSIGPPKGDWIQHEHGWTQAKLLQEIED